VHNAAFDDGSPTPSLRRRPRSASTANSTHSGVNPLTFDDGSPTPSLRRRPRSASTANSTHSGVNPLTFDDGEDTEGEALDDALLKQVWAAKVTGAWQLHHAVEGHALDWFALFCGTSSLFGAPGQAAHAAADSWLDAFAAWRSARGLPTLAVCWSPWGEGSLPGGATIPLDVGPRALGVLLAHRRVRAGVIPGEPDSWVPAAGRHSSLFDLLATAGGTADPAAERE
jgi:hypothetical protein